MESVAFGHTLCGAADAIPTSILSMTLLTMTFRRMQLLAKTGRPAVVKVSGFHQSSFCFLPHCPVLPELRISLHHLFNVTDDGACSSRHFNLHTNFLVWKPANRWQARSERSHRHCDDVTVSDLHCCWSTSSRCRNSMLHLWHGG